MSKLQATVYTTAVALPNPANLPAPKYVGLTSVSHRKCYPKWRIHRPLRAPCALSDHGTAFGSTYSVFTSAKLKRATSFVNSLLL